MQGEQITASASLRNTEWDTHNCVLGYPVIGELRNLCTVAEKSEGNTFRGHSSRSRFVFHAIYVSTQIMLMMFKTMSNKSYVDEVIFPKAMM